MFLELSVTLSRTKLYVFFLCLALMSAFWFTLPGESPVQGHACHSLVLPESWTCPREAPGRWVWGGWPEPWPDSRSPWAAASDLHAACPGPRGFRHGRGGSRDSDVGTSPSSCPRSTCVSSLTPCDHTGGMSQLQADPHVSFFFAGLQSILVTPSRSMPSFKGH